MGVVGWVGGAWVDGSCGLEGRELGGGGGGVKVGWVGVVGWEGRRVVGWRRRRVVGWVGGGYGLDGGCELRRRGL